jgi:hypothetical protein
MSHMSVESYRYLSKVASLLLIVYQKTNPTSPTSSYDADDSFIRRRARFSKVTLHFLLAGKLFRRPVGRRKEVSETAGEVVYAVTILPTQLHRRNCRSELVQELLV